MEMAVTDKNELPLKKTPGEEVIRVGETRVSLDTVIYSFKDGQTPEEIVQQYPALNLPDVYQVIAYYLKNEQEVLNYLEDREKEAEELHTQNEKEFDLKDIRSRLLSREKEQ